MRIDVNVLGGIVFLDWEIYIVVLIIISAVLCDLYTDKISNYIIILGFMGVLFNIFVDCLESGIQLNIISEKFLGCIVPGICLFPLFYLHMIGTGDIKLLMLLGCFLGINHIFICIFVSFLSGALISVWKMFRFQLFHERFAYFFNYMKKLLYTKEVKPYLDEHISDKCKIHFSIPISIGVFLIYILRGGLFA